MVKATEQEIINKIAHGDHQAFAEIVNDYQKKIFNTTFRMLGDREDALDLAQEAFLKIYKNIKSFKGKSSLSTWIFKITTNLCRDELRKRQRDLTTGSLSEKIETNEGEIKKEIKDFSFNPEKISLNNELKKQIQKIIDNLPMDQKEVIVLRDLEGFSYKEIAQITDVSLGTVKSRISRARRKLKEELNLLAKEGKK